MASHSRQPKSACGSENAGRPHSPEPDGTVESHIEEMDRKNAGAGLEAIMAIANERSEYLAHLKDALLRNDVEDLEFYASKLCGFTNWPAIREDERRKYAAEEKD